MKAHRVVLMLAMTVNDLRPSTFGSHHSSVGCLTKRCRTCDVEVQRVERFVREEFGADRVVL